MRIRQSDGERLERSVPVECLPRARVHAVGDGIEFFLAVDGQVRALGQVLAQQPVGVLARAALPWAVGVAEIHAHAGRPGQISVPSHLPALVVGQRLSHRLGHRVELGRERGQCGLGRRVLHLRQQHEEASTEVYAVGRSHTFRISSALNLDLPFTNATAHRVAAMFIDQTVDADSSQSVD